MMKIKDQIDKNFLNKNDFYWWIDTKIGLFRNKTAGCSPGAAKHVIIEPNTKI
jgi:hypothetical protein